MTLENELVRVELSSDWPSILRLERKGGGAIEMDDGDERAINIDGYSADGVATCPEPGVYRVWCEGPRLTFTLRFALQGEDLVIRLESLEEAADYQPSLWLPCFRAAEGTSDDGDFYLRHNARQRNWSRHWTPGTTIYDGWEDYGLVGDAASEPGSQWTNHACVWNEGICIGAISSVHVRPLMTRFRGMGRADVFQIHPGPHSYRLRGEIAEPFEFRIGILGDYNGDGKIDWADAAAWEGDRRLKANPLYKEALVYKLMMDLCDQPGPYRTFASTLEDIKLVHKISGGRKQIVYLVGWQHAGHDTGYPSHAQINPRCGTLEDFRKLIEEAKAYNCTVSIHGNLDDAYPQFPEFREDLLSRTDDCKHVWFHNALFNADVFSINHTLANETGYNADRAERLTKMLPLRESIHFDAHRCFNEVLTDDEGHIDAECEIQLGMIPIKKLFESYGLDITIEGTDDEVAGLYSWAWMLPDWNHGYRTVMHHGRTGGIWRANLPSGRGTLEPCVEGTALGQAFFRTELTGDTPESIEEHLILHWMTAQLLQRKKMTGHWVGDWNQGVRASYEGNTFSTGGVYGLPLEIWYEGLPVARGTDRFIPWNENEIVAYSLKGGPQEWTLPNGWDSVHVSASRLGESVEAPMAEIDGRQIDWIAQPRTVVRFTRG